MPFNCRAQISVSSTSRSGQRAPTGVSVPPAQGLGRAAAAFSVLPHRRHGRLGLQSVGRGQVRLHPRYARRGLPGSATPVRPEPCARLGPRALAPEGATRPASAAPLPATTRFPPACAGMTGAHGTLSQGSRNRTAARPARPGPGGVRGSQGEGAGGA